jgi:gliding motility-associated lipoprotein GldH
MFQQLIKPVSILLVMLGLFIFSACDPNIIYDEYQHISKDLWNRFDVKKFDIVVNDTVSFNDFYIDVRNTTDYQFSNLYLFIDSQFPNGQVYRDTIECILADRQGKWLGRGLGKIRDNRFLFKSMVRFSLKGTYVLKIQQAMRTEDLAGIADIGLRLEKH